MSVSFRSQQEAVAVAVELRVDVTNQKHTHKRHALRKTHIQLPRFTHLSLTHTHHETDTSPLSIMHHDKTKQTNTHSWGVFYVCRRDEAGAPVKLALPPHVVVDVRDGNELPGREGQLCRLPRRVVIQRAHSREIHDDDEEDLSLAHSLSLTLPCSGKASTCTCVWMYGPISRLHNALKDTLSLSRPHLAQKKLTPTHNLLEISFVNFFF